MHIRRRARGVRERLGCKKEIRNMVSGKLKEGLISTGIGGSQNRLQRLKSLMSRDHTPDCGAIWGVSVASRALLCLLE